ncbi:CDP-glucose 4,6-dehydratase [Stutzerimonas azotifigens]|uniref:CDP-glucose 4,6-dehydratase n=1 Tax=Stutzerimonas azotifigens TaxID=291995 RepID=A0ABR5Z4S1_9GAMM|nr:CDP-glucose 4,6-dehydratase [Stutzerimonas azotifigens]MBA1275234.1 CDP-glucose 4,6-dehydratase [Stutzerimonas azotifigens]
MPSTLDFEAALKGKRVLITGHTGFTGSWVCAWLTSIGAEVTGFALKPDTSPSLYEALGLASCIQGHLGDICDYDVVLGAIQRYQPELILHLAAQPLVRRSYREPRYTFAVNSQGTANVLDAARAVSSVKGVVCVTTDKVYKNNEWDWPYRENDPLGGKDPYSASKSAAEMVIQSYVASFPWANGAGPAIAIARGGNIIGGGDWSEDRLIPDFVRAVVSGETLTLRYPAATRPWQHVLALVHGYMVLMAGLLSENPEKYARAWNLGPHDLRQYSVRDVLELLSAHWERPKLDYMAAPLHEAGALALDSSLARNLLDWFPPWNTEQVIIRTAEWYRDYYRDPDGASATTHAQIADWRSALLEQKPDK